VRVELPPPSLADNSGDADRLLRRVKRGIGSDRIRLPLPLMRSLPAKLRKLAAQLYLNGMLDLRGKLVTQKCGNRRVHQKGIPAIVVVTESESADGKPLLITQIDIDSLIRSKAAMYTILETLTLHVGVSFDAIDTFGVAGTFGSFIDPEAAITIGMLPDLPRERFHVLGNISLEGATRLLTTPKLAKEIGPLRESLTCLELNVNQECMNRFSAARFLPHTDMSRFPSVLNTLSLRDKARPKIE